MASGITFFWIGVGLGDFDLAPNFLPEKYWKYWTSSSVHPLVFSVIPCLHLSSLINQPSVKDDLREALSHATCLSSASLQLLNVCEQIIIVS